MRMGLNLRGGRAHTKKAVRTAHNYSRFPAETVTKILLWIFIIWLFFHFMAAA